MEPLKLGKSMGFSNDTQPNCIAIDDRDSRACSPSLTFHPLQKDTSGKDHPSLAGEFALLTKTRPNQPDHHRRLVFRFRAAAPFVTTPTTTCGAFTPELWRNDCAEFFLTNPNTGHYLEFNLNPHGAWWAASFSAPRQLKQEEPFPDVLCTASGIEISDEAVNQHQWSAALSIPVAHIETSLGIGLEEMNANITAILNSPDQIFLTVAELGGDQPDFHRPTDWLPVHIDGRPS